MSVENLFTMAYSGKKYYPGRPFVSEFSVPDIAHALAQTNRYGGAAKFPFSVAQHSALMAEKMYAATKSGRLALDCLFHDASEAYLGDMPKPIKHMLRDYQELEDNTDRAIRHWLNKNKVYVPFEQTKECKEYDIRMFLTEWPILKDHEDAGQWYPNHEPFDDVAIEPWTWEEAKTAFMNMAKAFAFKAAEETKYGV